MKDTKLSPSLVKSDADWRATLTPEQYQVLRQKGTERPFSGALWDEHRSGTYRCAGCGAELFRSDAKFESGTGWPSFFDPADPTAVATQTDRSFFMTRTEAECARLRRSPWTRLRGRPEPDRPALLHQLGLADARSGGLIRRLVGHDVICRGLVARPEGPTLGPCEAPDDSAMDPVRRWRPSCCPARRRSRHRRLEPSLPQAAIQSPQAKPTPTPTPTPTPIADADPIADRPCAGGRLLVGDGWDLTRRHSTRRWRGEARPTGASSWPARWAGATGSTPEAIRAAVNADPRTLGLLPASEVTPDVRALAVDGVDLFGNDRLRDVAGWPLLVPAASGTDPASFDPDDDVDPGRRRRRDARPIHLPAHRSAGQGCATNRGTGAPRRSPAGAAAPPPATACRSCGERATPAPCEPCSATPTWPWSTWKALPWTASRWHPHGLVFTFDPALLTGLAGAGIDAVTIANNHIGNAGPGGVVETIRHLDALGIAHVGAGRNRAAAHAPAWFDIAGQRVALFGYDAIRPAYNATATSGPAARAWPPPATAPTSPERAVPERTSSWSSPTGASSTGPLPPPPSVLTLGRWPRQARRSSWEAIATGLAPWNRSMAIRCSTPSATSSST